MSEEITYANKLRINAFLDGLAMMVFIPCGWCGAGLIEGSMYCKCCGFPASYRGPNIKDFKQTKKQSITVANNRIVTLPSEASK